MNCAMNRLLRRLTLKTPVTGRFSCFALAFALLAGAPAALQAADLVSPSVWLAQASGEKKGGMRFKDGKRSVGVEKAKETGEETESDEGDEKAASGSRSLQATIKQYAPWIVVGLVAAIGGVLVWVFLGGKTRGEEAFAALDDTPASNKENSYSSTRISAREVDHRLQVESSEVETNKEYALVVDEDALGGESAEAADEPSEVDALLGASRFDDAYDVYLEAIETSQATFSPHVEARLSEHFLSKRRFDKAARVLEHHVESQPAGDVDSEAYFNLGYVHFFGRKLQKSRRFLKLYVERETDPQKVERAKKILAQLEPSGPMS